MSDDRVFLDALLGMFANDEGGSALMPGRSEEENQRRIDAAEAKRERRKLRNREEPWKAYYK